MGSPKVTDILLAPLLWAASIAVKAPTWALGFFVVPFLWRYRYTELDNLPLWAIPWANPEDWHGGFKNYDGSIPTWYRERMKDRPEWWQFYRYHAMRNPADGLRNIEWLQLWIKKEKVWYWTPKFMTHYEPWWDRTPGWRGYVAGQGPYVGFKIQWVRKKTYSEIKFGFRVEPNDAKRDLPDTSARKHLGASFASKIKWNSDI